MYVYLLRGATAAVNSAARKIGYIISKYLVFLVF